MKITFDKLSEQYKEEVMEIYNYYIENTYAAYPGNKLPSRFFDKLKEEIGDYPAYVVKNSNEVVGFCFLASYKHYQTFRETAVISTFLDYKVKGLGVGDYCLRKLEEDARQFGIKNILAIIPTKNNLGVRYYHTNGFRTCGTISDIATKFGQSFGLIIMKKVLSDENKDS
ncbi:MAG: GNAT family N-acetyltransferase [Terrisporobacter sp.]|uniref:GNAT family N-acetyltransferase n=1 Tax=Terrisporobacter sp. TaxID=1965305 RepID=UPI002FCB519D